MEELLSKLEAINLRFKEVEKSIGDPDLIADQNEGGTWSLATIYFTTYAEGESDLEFDTETTILRDANNEPVLINEFGLGKVNID